MLHKTRGIVLRTTDYSESSVIVQIFTEKFGMQSYLLSGVKKPRSRISMNMLQPLHLLDMVVYFKPNGNVQRAAELRSAPAFESIPYDIIKSSLVIFINEVLYKSIRQHGSDERLFEFVFSSIEVLDHLQEGLANFHLWFLLQLSKYLGFYPDKASSREVACFDLKDGVFASHAPGHVHTIEGRLAAVFLDLLNCNTESLPALKVSPAERRELLGKIIEYYHLHIDNLGKIKSHLILEDVLN